jgi:predicted nucleic acid-binding protein
VAALNLYLDSSVVVPLFLPDVFVAEATALLENAGGQVVISDFVAAEFSSVVAIRLRNKDLTPSAARLAFSGFDSWCDLYAESAKTLPSDVEDAKSFIRRLDLPLRTPDAINLAIAKRLGLELATFDKKMAASARRLGISVVKA